jgi:hypothetical protein
VELPTAAQIRTWSKVDFANLEYEPPAGEEEDPLAIVVARAADYVWDVTGRTAEDVPTALVTTAQEAIQRRTEQNAFQDQDDSVETAADDLIQSMSAGSYSESKRKAGELAVSNMKMVNPWPRLNDLLWRLMTDEKREWWEEQITGKHAPYGSITEVDWEGGDIVGRMADDPYLFGA